MGQKRNKDPCIDHPLESDNGGGLPTRRYGKEEKEKARVFRNFREFPIHFFGTAKLRKSRCN
jgi:hypothetical protein